MTIIIEPVFENTFFTDDQRKAMKQERKNAIDRYRKLQVTRISNIVEYQKQRSELKREIASYYENVYKFNLTYN